MGSHVKNPPVQSARAFGGTLHHPLLAGGFHNLRALSQKIIGMREICLEPSIKHIAATTMRQLRSPPQMPVHMLCMLVGGASHLALRKRTSADRVFVSAWAAGNPTC
eukprot:73506-Chlamydomonas_euryale.AAC.7